MVDLSAPKGGVMMDDLKKENHSMSQQTLYGQSKCGNVLIGSEFGKLVGKDGIISVVSLSSSTSAWSGLLI